jgi:transposase
MFPKKERAGQAFRAAASLSRSQNELGDFYRRVRSRSGPKQAVVATARKIAVIWYNMISKGEEFCPIGNEEYKEQYKNKKIKYLLKQLNRILLFQLVISQMQVPSLSGTLDQ